ncbi:MAG: hypothetical protein ABI995_06350, partial [Acidobacteriota bacterium]
MGEAFIHNSFDPSRPKLRNEPKPLSYPSSPTPPKAILQNEPNGQSQQSEITKRTQAPVSSKPPLNHQKRILQNEPNGQKPAIRNYETNPSAPSHEISEP